MAVKKSLRGAQITFIKAFIADHAEARKPLLLINLVELDFTKYGKLCAKDATILMMAVTFVTEPKVSRFVVNGLPLNLSKLGLWQTDTKNTLLLTESTMLLDTTQRTVDGLRNLNSLTIELMVLLGILYERLEKSTKPPPMMTLPKSTESISTPSF